MHTEMDVNSFENQRGKFRVRGKWELILVLLVVIAGVVVTTIAVLKAKEKRDSLHLPSESGKSVIDSTPTRLLSGDGVDPNGADSIYVDHHHQAGDVRLGSRQKELGSNKNGGYDNGGDVSGHHRRQNLNRYQAEKGFGNGNNGGGGSGGDLGGFESAPEGRRVRLKHRTTYGGIIVDDDDEEPEADAEHSSSSNQYKQSTGVSSNRHKGRQVDEGEARNSGNAETKYYYPKMASNPLLRSDGLPGYPGPPGFDPAVYFDEKQTSNGPPSVEYSAPSAGFLLSSSSDPSSVAYDDGLEHHQQQQMENSAYSDVKTSSSSLSHQKMAHQQNVGGPTVAVVAPPSSHEQLPVAFPKASGTTLAAVEKRYKGGFSGSALGLPKSSIVPPHHLMMMSSAPTNGGHGPHMTNHQDIYRILAAASAATSPANSVGGSGSPGGLVSGSGYEGANYLTSNELMWLQQTRPELFGGHMAAAASEKVIKTLSPLAKSSSSSSLSSSSNKNNHRHKRSSSSDDHDHHHQSSLLEEWAQAEAEAEESGRKRRSRYMNPKSYHDDEADNGDAIDNNHKNVEVVNDDEGEKIENHKPEKRRHLKKRLTKATSEKKFSKKMTTATTTKKPLPAVNDRANRYTTTINGVGGTLAKTSESQQQQHLQQHPYQNILGSGNFEVIRGGILDKSSDDGKYKLKSGESDSGDSKVLSRKKDTPADGGFTDYGNGNGGGDEDEKSNAGEEEGGGGEGEGVDNNNNTDENGNTGIPGDTFEPFNFDFFNNNEPILGFQGYDNFEPASKPEYEKTRY